MRFPTFSRRLAFLVLLPLAGAREWAWELRRVFRLGLLRHRVNLIGSRGLRHSPQSPEERLLVVITHVVPPDLVNLFTSIPGVSGKAVQGVSQKAISYASANDFSKATSFTIAFWEKNSVPVGSPQFLFSLDSKDYWHQSALFALVDHQGAGSTSTDAVVKLAVQDQWFEFTPSNGRMPGNLLNGDWHHVVFVYDQSTSMLSYYVDGKPLTNLKPSQTNVTNNGTPRAALSFANIYGFVLGGWNKHANLGNGAPTDDWIQSWQGGLDQFRLYGKALSASEVQALYNSKL